MPELSLSQASREARRAAKTAGAGTDEPKPSASAIAPRIAPSAPQSSRVKAEARLAGDMVMVSLAGRVLSAASFSIKANENFACAAATVAAARGAAAPEPPSGSVGAWPRVAAVARHPSDTARKLDMMDLRTNV